MGFRGRGAESKMRKVSSNTGLWNRVALRCVGQWLEIVMTCIGQGLRGARIRRWTCVFGTYFPGRCLLGGANRRNVGERGGFRRRSAEVWVRERDRGMFERDRMWAGAIREGNCVDPEPSGPAWLRKILGSIDRSRRRFRGGDWRHGSSATARNFAGMRGMPVSNIQAAERFWVRPWLSSGTETGRKGLARLCICTL